VKYSKFIQTASAAAVAAKKKQKQKTFFCSLSKT
jgi:hypothetical protein